MFNIDFVAYNLVSINTAVEAPNMNSIMERFFRTARREALDNFLLIGRNQIQGILEEYVVFYNTQRPHQGIRQQIPKPDPLVVDDRHDPRTVPVPRIWRPRRETGRRDLPD